MSEPLARASPWESSKPASGSGTLSEAQSYRPNSPAPQKNITRLPAPAQFLKELQVPPHAGQQVSIELKALWLNWKREGDHRAEQVLCYQVTGPDASPPSLVFYRTMSKDSKT